MNGGILVAIMVPLAFFAMVFGIIYLYKRENLAMIEKGFNPRDSFRRPAPYRNLKWGLLLIGSGLGLLAAYLIDVFAMPYRIEPAPLYFALLAIGGGLGLVVSYRVEKKEVLDKE